VLNVLNVKQENNVYFINVSDHVAVNNNENITYEISAVDSSNTTAEVMDFVR
jgi:hypothetical protein